MHTASGLWHYIAIARGKANRFPSVTFETRNVQLW